MSQQAAPDNPVLEIKELEQKEFMLHELQNIAAEERKRKHKREVKDETEYATGLLQPKTIINDIKSQNYFNGLSRRRVSIPDSYSSVDLGLVSPVKDQLNCGSCVAFSNLAVIETCFKKLIGVFGDYSEQQLIDCGYNGDSVDGCKGAYVDAYIDWATKTKTPLIHEYNYPYLNLDPKLICPSNIPAFNQGAKVNKKFTLQQGGTEDLLKQAVYTHGAVTSTVSAEDSFKSYKGGLFSGCTSNNRTHAVTVVGYGTENGVDYWLIKNSWGTSWGERGFMKLKRGVGMCGIGMDLAAVTCTKADGPISETPTTKPCMGKWIIILFLFLLMD